MKIMVINGPNIDMLGIREPDIYGENTYANLLEMLKEYAEEKNIDIVPFQSNIEGEIVNAIHTAYFDGFDGIVINPAAYTRALRCICQIFRRATSSEKFRTPRKTVSDKLPDLDFSAIKWRLTRL